MIFIDTNIILYINYGHNNIIYIIFFFSGKYGSGTGVIVEEPKFSSPLLMTCNHIIPTEETAKASFVYFDREDNQKQGTAVEGEKLFDFSTFKTSPVG